MKKLLTIFMLFLTPAIAKAGVEDTSKFVLRISESVSDHIIKSIETGHFEYIMKDMESTVILMIQTDKMTRLVTENYNAVDFLNKVLTGVKGKAEIYSKDGDYYVYITTEDRAPMVISLNMNTKGKIYKVVLS